MTPRGLAGIGTDYDPDPVACIAFMVVSGASEKSPSVLIFVEAGACFRFNFDIWKSGKNVSLRF